MDSRQLIFQIIRFIAYVGVQVVLLKNLVIFDSAFCLVYIGFLLFMPIDIGRPLLMLIGFFLGLTVDIFYDSLGIHAAASVLLGYIRPTWINALTPQGGYDIGISPGYQKMGFGWYFAYSGLLLLIHHLTIFYIEAGGFHLFFFTLVKVIFSTLFTFLVLLLIQLLFSRGSRS